VGKKYDETQLLYYYWTAYDKKGAFKDLLQFNWKNNYYMFPIKFETEKSFYKSRRRITKSKLNTNVESDHCDLN